MDTMAGQDMDQLPLIAVTGVTGNIGGAAAAALSAEGYPLRLLARDSSLGRVPRLNSRSPTGCGDCVYGLRA